MKQRQALTVEERIEKNRLITENYFKLFEKERPEVVHLFLSIASKEEVDTRFILEKLNTEYPHVKTVTSVIAEDQRSLLTIEVRRETPLVLNRWSIPEPATRLAFPTHAIQEVLTPLLAVDASGYRLGYGKGFYDRFFAVCSSAVVKTGINFFPVVPHDLPKDEWDVALHRLVCPEGTFVIQQKA
ncbi:MAG: ygfA [Cytophagaceae bacterium]|jgi:5-formyltetrahydrofolate cyclo-ligase|nr:ygfA [Cytophagaceae bacterium]